MLAPIAILTLALAALWARMVQVQIFEHEIWAREATNLVRSGTILPFRRGRILDRTGTREIVRDEEVYRVEFVWRDFRREHPLGHGAIGDRGKRFATRGLHEHFWQQTRTN